RAIEVVAPRVRPALAWLEGVHAASAVAIVADGELLGGLVSGDGNQRPHVSLARARTLSTIASDAAGRLSIEASAARAVARAHRSQVEATKAIDDELRAEAALAAMVERRSIDLEARSRDARLRAYAPASRQLHDAIAAAAQTTAAVALAHPATIDPSTWIALWFQRSQRTGALETIDAALLATFDESLSTRYLEARVTAATEGAIAIVAAERLGVRDRDRLEIEIDRLDARERPRLLFATSRLAAIDPSLLEGGAPVIVPPLRLRLDDLRGVALDHLARLGEAIDGAPLGISDSAIVELLEYDWPGDDAELAIVLTRAAIARLRRASLDPEGPDRRRVDARDLALSTLKIAGPQRASP
ncbi:MAG: hypothetical protein ACHREM_30175, partial [Polyangiales bacterium]